MAKPNYFHMLDSEVWEEMPVRNVGANGYVYVGRRYHDEYEARVFLKKRDDSKNHSKAPKNRNCKSCTPQNV